MNKTVKKLLQYTLFIGLAVVLLWFAFKDQEWSKIKDALLSANYWWISLSVLMGFIAFVNRGLRWNVMLEPMGYKPKAGNSVAAVIFGYLANLAFPRAGELARCTALYQVERVPVNTLFGTVILERVIDFVMLLSVLGLTFLLNLQDFGDFFIRMFSGEVDFTLKTVEPGTEQPAEPLPVWIWYTLGGLMLGGLLFLIVFWKRVLNHPFGKKAKEFIRGVIDGFAQVRKMRRKWVFIFHTLSIWVMYWGMTYVAFFALDATHELGPADGLFVLVLGGFGMVVPAQGGVGSYHVIVAVGMAAVYGINEVGALAFATVVHASQTLLVLAVGIASMAYLSLSRRKMAKDGPADNTTDQNSTAGAAAQ